MTAWYNENDHQTVAWLRELIRRGCISPGAVDERSIKDIKSSDCAENSHFFAGIGGWAHALALAGWPQDMPVWTGSCPCQPFSSAGKGGGFNDPRHLWPVWKKLIKKCRPPVVFGEQVASPLGREWVARVQADLEALGYAVGRADVCAASVGAPQMRQRIWWVADSERIGWRGRSNGYSARKARGVQAEIKAQGSSAVSRMGDTDNRRLSARIKAAETARYRSSAIADGGPWSNFDLLPCLDGKSRRIESGTFPLAQRVPSSVGRLRGYGNAIVPQVAAVFVKAYMEIKGDL